MEGGIERKLRKGTGKPSKANLLDMKLKDFLEYTELYKDKRIAFKLVRSLIGNLCYKEGRYYNMGIKKVKDLYKLTGEDVFLKMTNYGVRTVEALNEVLKSNGLPSTSMGVE